MTITEITDAVPNPLEVAEILDSGTHLAYSDWETVMVQHRWAEAYPIFEFAATEPATEPMTVAQILFNIGQKVTIFLGGIQAITGVITVRQSASDKERHGLQLIGKGYSWQMVKSSIKGVNGGGYDFSDQGIIEITKTIAGETGVGVKTVGAVNNMPFPSLSVAPGANAFDFIDDMCRHRGVILGSDELGNILLIGQNTPVQGGDFVYGPNGNIEKINVVISNETVFANVYATGQTVGNDQTNGTAASEMIAGPIPGLDSNPSNLVAQAEVPDTPAGIMNRAVNEAKFHDGTIIRITLSVQGWVQKQGDSVGDLWRVGHSYKVNAPDHLPPPWNNILYAAQTITFQQDDESGTMTTLELVLPWLLNGNLFQPGTPNLPQPSDVPFGQTPPGPG